MASISPGILSYISSIYNGNNTHPQQLIPNPIVVRQRRVTRIIYATLLISALTFLVVYSILWAQIQPPLNLHETGNSWTFILFLTTCGVVACLAIIVLSIDRWNKGPLRWKHLAGIDLILLASWSSLILVVMGALEQIQNRKNCPKDANVACGSRYGPKVSTTFGLYVAGVCGTNLTEWDIKSGLTPTSTMDPVKCEATKLLKTEIYYMYVWVVEIFVMVVLEVVLGLGSCRNRNQPEALYGRS